MAGHRKTGLSRTPGPPPFECFVVEVRLLGITSTNEEVVMAKPPAKGSKPAAKRQPAVVIVGPDSSPKRKGVHAKRGTSQQKTSKNYKKPYRGQGR